VRACHCSSVSQGPSLIFPSSLYKSTYICCLLFGNDVYRSLQNLSFTLFTVRGARLPSLPCRNYNNAVIIVVTGNAKHGLYSRICTSRKLPLPTRPPQPPETHPSTYPDNYIPVSCACILPPGHLPRPVHTQNASFCIHALSFAITAIIWFKDVITGAYETIFDKLDDAHFYLTYTLPLNFYDTFDSLLGDLSPDTPTATACTHSCACSAPCFTSACYTCLRL
jgi:hypothetical protein